MRSAPLFQHLMMPSRFLLTIASSLESIMEASQRNRCSLSRSAASISLGLEAIPTLLTCLQRPHADTRLLRRHYSNLQSSSDGNLGVFWDKTGRPGLG